MKFQEIIDRACEDPAFAEELKAKSIAAARAGVDTDEWEEFMAYFAEDADELARMRIPGQSVNGVAVGDAITTTFTVGHGINTVFLGLTTTTTEPFKEKQSSLKKKGRHLKVA